MPPRRRSKRAAAKNSYEFLEAAAFNVIVDETNAKTRMSDIDRFTPAFPKSRFDESVASYAMMSLSELKDTTRVVAYGEKALAANPNNLAALLLLAGTTSKIPKPGAWPKALPYAQRAVVAAKADAPDADRTRKLSAGVAHSTLGYADMKQDKDRGCDCGIEVRYRAAQRPGRPAVRGCAHIAWVTPTPRSARIPKLVKC